jgi:hypothetical protein
MKHASTRAVHAYWDQRRGHRPAPSRDDIDPAAIRQSLGDTFLLSADFVDQLRFRLAGTRICALFCRELKGEILAALCSEDSRKTLEDALSVIAEENAGVVAGLTGHADDGAKIELEMLLLPLARVGHARTSVLGVLTPLAPVYWLGAKPVLTLELATVRHLGAATATQRLTVPLDGSQLHHGFTVYTGGLAEPSNERAG